MKVLHVDDEPGQLHFAKEFIEINESSIKIESVNSPSMVLKLLEENDFDCVVSDYNMLPLDGIENTDMFATLKRCMKGS